MSLTLDGTNDRLIANAYIGDTGPFSVSRISIAITDANTTLNASQYIYGMIAITGTITTTRNIVLPLTAGAVLYVENLVSGGSLQFIGGSGTGITVAVGKRAIIGCDGTNWNRFAADI